MATYSQMAYFWSRLEISGGRRLNRVLGSVYYDAMTALHAQTVQCGPSLASCTSTLLEIGIEHIAQVDLVHRTRVTLSHLGLKRSHSIIVNGPKHSIELTTSSYFEP